MFSLGIHRRALALAVATASIVAGGLAAAPASAEGEPVITWPTVTDLNPSTSQYPLTVQYDGPDHLFVVVGQRLGSGRVAQPLPSHGTVEVVFPEGYDGTYDLTVRQCPTETFQESCPMVGAWHGVNVFDEVAARMHDRALRGPATPFTIEFGPYEAVDLDIAWEIVPAGNPSASPLLSGEDHVVAQRQVDLTLPSVGTEALHQGGHYRFQASFRGNFPSYGVLEGAAATEFEWDSVNGMRGIRLDVYDEELGKTVRGATVVYPHPDPGTDWRDSVTATLLKDEPEVIAELETTVIDASGEVVVSYEGNVWDGRDDEGALAPEGTYTFRLKAVDRQGNAETFERVVRVSLQVLDQMSQQLTISPKRSIVDRFVGKCGRIQSPARRGWTLSIGLRSSASGPKCRTLAAQTVSTVHGIYLPDSPLGQKQGYPEIQVSLFGGGAPQARWAYLIHAYWTRDKKWVGRKQFERKLGWHRGAELGSKSNAVLKDAGNGRFYLLWSVGLAEGAGYDVKSFRVQIRYWGLRSPRP